MVEEKKSSEYDDDGFKFVYCKNPKCRRYLTKVNTATECSLEISCKYCGTVTLYRIAHEKIVPKGHRSPGTTQ